MKSALLLTLLLLNLHLSVIINNLQNHHKDLGHYLGPPNSPSPPRLCCMKSPGAPLHSAELRAWHPETQEQSYRKGKSSEASTIKHIPNVHIIIITLHYHWEIWHKKGKRFINTLYNQITCNKYFLTFPPLSLSHTVLYATLFY